MKKQLAVLTATAVLGVTSAFAANPFSDVTPQDWAYQAVAQLASQGVVNGYPDGTFQGQHNITRYEMAQMVAKAMARQDRTDAEQNAVINRLANEFSSELKTLGVKVATLEDKVGNFKFTGDARIRFDRTSNDLTTVKVDKEKTEENTNKSKFEYRARVNFDATVNDNTKASVRVVALDKALDGSNGINATVDNAYVQHNFGKYVTATAGRYDADFGAGLTYSDAVEGLTVKAGTDALSGSVTFAHPTAAKYNGVLGANDKKGAEHYSASQYTYDFLNDGPAPELTVFQVDGKIGSKVNLGAFYTKVHSIQLGNSANVVNALAGDKHAADTGLDFYGAYAKADLGHKVMADVEFARFKDIKNSNAWAAGLGYGDYNIAKPGTWDAKVQYFNFDVLAPIFSTTHATPFTQNYKTWMVTGQYAVAQNVGVKALATVGAKDKDGNNVPNRVRAELNYKF